MITLASPFGPFSMTGDGTFVTAAVFGTDVVLPEGHVPTSTIDAVKSYFEGDISALSTIPVRQHGAPYLEECWTALRTLTEPVTYTELAQITGRPTAARAAAQGCARNQIGLIVPCHRVLRTDGGLGGYRWGVQIKRQLLAHERHHIEVPL